MYWLADQFPDAHVTAIDIDAEAIDACQDGPCPRRYAGRVSFAVSYFSDLEPESARPDHRLRRARTHRGRPAAVDDLFRVLRPDGSLLVHVPRNVWTHRDGRQEIVPDDEA